MFNEQQQQQKRLKRQKFIDIAAIFQNFLSRNGRFSFEKLENIYSYCCYLFLKKKSIFCSQFWAMLPYRHVPDDRY